MGKVMRAVLAPCPLLLTGCHRWRGAGRASGDKLCSELSRVWLEFVQQCLDADSRATAGTICYFLSLSQTETLPGAGGDLFASGIFFECLGRSSGQGQDEWPCWDQGLHQPCTLTLRSFSVPPAVVHISKTQRRGQGTLASACSAICGNGIWQLPGVMGHGCLSKTIALIVPGVHPCHVSSLSVCS